jgi:hypothetical protein
MIESPKPGQSITDGSSILVSGWALDTTANGWAGFDQMQVYDGARDSGGTKLVDGTVGESRPDIADSFGGNFANSGFSATVPSSALNTLTGTQDLYVYLHTPSKGWWYRSVNADLQAAPPPLPYPDDPVNVILRPCCNETITAQQWNSQYVFVGYALDRNPPSATPNGEAGFGPDRSGPGQSGIDSVALYLDALPGQPGSISLGNAYEGVEPSVNNQPPHSGPLADYPGFPTITRTYGPQYEFSGWVLGWNPTNTQTGADADSFHTLYAVAKSSITGKTSVASSQFYIKNAASACSVVGFLHHNCDYLLP